ncbi:unnamed protein product [Pylaiella littoralis]
MHHSREKNGGQTLRRTSSALCCVGICCATWRGLEIATRRYQAARVLTLEAEVPRAKSPGREVLRALGAEETQQIGAEGSSVFSAGGDRIGVITEEKEATNGGTRAAESVFAASAQEDDKFHPDRFWEAYATDRHSLLTRGVVAGEGGGENGGDLETVDTSRVRPTKYVVFVTNYRTAGGLGNHMVGMMSAFAFSIATGRVFLHDWTKPREMSVGYDDIFVPPFKPWDTSAANGSYVSGPNDILGENVDFENDTAGGGDGPTFDLEIAPSAGRSWVILPEVAVEENEDCSLDFGTPGGVQKHHFVDVFIEKRGQDPRPDCPVIFIQSNQYLVDLLSSPAYGSSKVGNTPISEWLSSGRAAQTLFAGLFRPVATVRQRLADESARLYAMDQPTIAAHARATFLQDITIRDKFVGCMEQLALSNNATRVLLATESDSFQEYVTSTLELSGVEVVSMSGVERLGEGNKMRDSLEKIQMALTEMILVGEADFVVTSPRSSFSALAAASGEPSTQRFGGISCEQLMNDPEFHSLQCAVDKWTVAQVQDPEEWAKLYPVVVDNNRRRCES